MAGGMAQRSIVGTTATQRSVFHLHPGGMIDNSPTIHRWGDPGLIERGVPKGRLTPLPFYLLTPDMPPIQPSLRDLCNPERGPQR